LSGEFADEVEVEEEEPLSAESSAVREQGAGGDDEETEFDTSVDPAEDGDPEDRSPSSASREGVNTQAEDETKQRIFQDVLAELRRELAATAWEEVIEEIMPEVVKELREDLEASVRSELRDELEDDVRNDLKWRYG